MRFPAGTKRKYRTPGSDFCIVSSATIPEQHGFWRKMNFCHRVFKNQAKCVHSTGAERHMCRDEEDPGAVADKQPAHRLLALLLPQLCRIKPGSVHLPGRDTRTRYCSYHA